MFRRQRARLPYLILMTDERRGGDPVALARRLPRGAGVILRHDAAPDRPALAASLARLCRARGLRFLVARDEALALRHHAGLHLADGMHPPLRFRLERRRSGALLTMAAHGPAALARARRAGADLALLSPLLPTPSHPGGRALGTARFAALARRAGVAVAALGGITAHRVAAARAAGACSVAAIGALGPPR